MKVLTLLVSALSLTATNPPIHSPRITHQHLYLFFPTNPLQALHTGNTGLEPEHWDSAVCRTAMLAAAARLDPVKDLSGVAQFLKRHTASGQDETWTTRHYNEQFAKIPELEELTK